MSVEGGQTSAVILEEEAELLREPRNFLKKQFYWIYQCYLGKEGMLAKDKQEWIEDALNTLIKLTPQRVFTWDW